MERVLLRMERPLAGLERATPSGYDVAGFEPVRYADAIPDVYARAFGDEPWGSDWREFVEYDPNGVFVAVDEGQVVGFAICFRRDDFGYISVVAVVPEHRRRGLASALVGRCTAYLISLGLGTVRIDAWEDSTPAVAAYESLGFAVYERRVEIDE